MKGILQSAVPRYLGRSPLFGLKRLRVTKPSKRLVEPEEEDRLLAELDPVDRAIHIMGTDTLCRLGNILDLRREDDHGNALVIRETKTVGDAEPHRVPVSTRLRAALDAIPGDDGYYFVKRRVARTARDRRGGVRQAFARAAKRANIPWGRAHGVTFHWATRRSGATRMLSGGVDPATVMKMGAWRRPEVVLGLYHELRDADAKRAVEVPGARSGGPTTKARTTK